MNEYLEFFKVYLFSRKHSKATVKNYIADISRFIKWYESTYPKQFKPADISKIIIQRYFDKTINSNIYLGSNLSARSIIRHQASIRKFFKVLTDENIINSNHLLSDGALITVPLNHQDNQTSFIKQNLKAFNDYLYRSKCSAMTTKNYLADIRHFLDWIDKVIDPKDINILYKYITNQTIEAYKERLLKDKAYSPLSVNRKLSAIRKYILWLDQENLIGQNQLINLSLIENITSQPLDAKNFSDIYLKSQEVIYPKQNLKSSRFAPIRLFNSLNHLIGIIFDGLLILPFIGILQKAQLSLYTLFGLSIFKSVLKSTESLSNATSVDSLIIKGISLGEKTVSLKTGIPKFTNISKHFYDPLDIALDNLPFHKKAYHILRHIRPLWYKKYHQNPLSHYLHFSFLLVFIGILVYWFNLNLFSTPSSSEPVFASLPFSPPRFLSFKGKLTDEDNNPINRASTLRFSLYRDEKSSGSALLWQEVLSVIPDEKGNFYAMLGRNTPLTDNTINNNPDLYLGVTQGKSKEMSPRQKIATVGLSADSQSLQGLTPITSSGDYKNTLLALDSAGYLSISGKDGPKFQATEGSFALSGESLILETNIGRGGSIILNPDSTGIIDLQKPLQNTTLNNNFTEALGSVEVNDTFAILATSSAQAALNIRQDSTGTLINASSAGVTRFTLDSVGNTMIHGSLALNGGSITSNQTTFNFLPDTVVNLNIGASSTELNLGSTSGNTIIRNNLLTNGNVTLGQNQEDSIFLNGRIASSILASESAKFDIGSRDNSFNNAYLTNLFLSPQSTTSGYLKRENSTVSLLNQTDSLLLGGSSINSALIRLAGTNGQDTFFNAGRVGIGLASSISDSLQVYGDIRIGTAGSDGCLKRFDGTALIGSCSSDEKLKKDIKSIENVLDKLTSLTPVTYSMRDSEFPEYNFGQGVSYGLIAQEVEKIFPELVDIDENGYKTVKYGPELTMLSLAGIKELNSKLNNLQSIKTDQEINELGDIYLIKDDNEYRLEDTSGKLYKNYSAFLKSVIGSLRVGMLSANEAVIDNLAVTTERISIAGLSLQEYILKTVEDSLILNKQGIKTPQLFANNIKTDLISPLASDSEIAISLEDSKFTIFNSESASASAVATFDRQGNATLSGSLQAQNLISNEASISGDLRAGRIIADEIEGLDNKLATLAAQQNKSTNSANITNIYNVYNNASNSASENQQSIPTPAISPVSLADTSQIASSSAEKLNSQFLTLNSELSTDFIPLASNSAALAYVPNLSSDFSTIHQGLMVLGYTSVVDLSVSDQISINGNFILAENSINVLGADLEIQPLKQGNIRFMSGLMTLDTQGNLAVFGDANFAKNVKIDGKLSTSLIAPIPGSDLVIQLPGNEMDSQTIINNANSASQQVLNNNKLVVKNASGSGVLTVNNLGDIIASGTASFKDIAVNSLNIVRGASADTSAIDTVASGSAGVNLITKGYTTRTIYSPFVKEDSLIYISPKSQTTGSVPYLSRQTAEENENGIKGSFTVQIPNISNEDVMFNWWVVN